MSTRRSRDSRHMNGFLLRVVFNAVAIYVTAYVVAGIQYDGGIVELLIAGLLFGALNAVLKPLLVFLSLPLIIVTLGLFYFVLNGIILLLLAMLLPSLSISGIFSAVVGSLLLGFINLVLHWLISSGR